MPTIEIPYATNDELRFYLDQILKVIEPFGRTLDWFIVEFEPSNWTKTESWITPPEWVFGLWRTIDQCPAIKLEWGTLQAFAEEAGHFDNALMVAVKPGGILPIEPLDLNGSDFEIAVQAFDSCLWAITSQHGPLLDLVCTQFPRAIRVPSTTRYY